ncbi:VCBS domain-containing protein, partial [Rhodobacteraceae bacterium]|nr:VCBS domain-containing protein [Paracoccaceae bacterium]
DFLGSGERISARFTITLDDGEGGTDSQQITVNLLGKNNAPTITVDTDDAVSASIHEPVGNTNVTVSDTLTITDTNISDTVTSQVVSGTISYRGQTATAMENAALEWLSLGNSTVLDATTASAQMTWSFDAGSEYFHDLAAGETAVLTYLIRVTDDAPDGSHLSAEKTITITINGSNDAPVITNGDDTVDLDETDAALTANGVMTVTDPDLTNSVTSAATLVVTGTSDRNDSAAPSDAALAAMFSISPTATLNASQTTADLAWAFDSSAESFDYLAEGETLVLTYTIVATDNDAAAGTDSSTVVITITGSSDAPIISQGPDTAAVTETNAKLATSGTLLISDVDSTDSVTVSAQLTAITGNSNRADVNAPSDNRLESYLTVSPAAILSASNTQATLDWAFDTQGEAFDYLAQGEELVLQYTITATDNSSGALSASETVTITITGTNDAPVISLLSDDSDTAAMGETNGTLSQTGTLTVADADTKDLVSAAVVDVIASGDTDGLSSDSAALLAMVSFAQDSVIDTTETDGVITWQFNSGTQAFDYLALNERLTLTYTVRVTDTAGETDEHQLVLVIDGTNDVPTLDAGASENFVESIDASAQVLSQQGSVSFTDADVSDTVSISYASDDNITWSGGVLDPVLASKILDGFDVQGTDIPATGSVLWTYAISADDFDFLAAGETITFSYTVSLNESQGETLSETLDFAIVGTNDSPVLQTVAGMTFVDTAEDDRFAAISGRLDGSDFDQNDSLTYSITNQVSSVAVTGFDQAVVGTYGTLYLNSQTGAYQYSPHDKAINALTLDASETFELNVSDDAETARQTLVVTITAANDTPEITASVTSATYVETDQDDEFNVVIGTLSGSDRDANATAEYLIEGAVSDLSRDGFDQRVDGQFGALYLNSVTGVYVFVPDDTAIEALAEGVKERDSFTLVRSDGSASANTRFDVWVVGAADQPIITEAGDEVDLA